VENRLRRRLSSLLPVVHPSGAHPALIRLDLREFRQAVILRGPSPLLACPQRLPRPVTRLDRHLPIRRCPALMSARRRTMPRLRLHRLLPLPATRQVLFLR
jgi:hypothetical protein